MRSWARGFSTARAAALFSLPRTRRTTRACSVGPTPRPYVKDGSTITSCTATESGEPAQTGTKAAAHYQLQSGPGEKEVIRLRLSCPFSRHRGADPFGDFDESVAARFDRCRRFLRARSRRPLSPATSARVMRQALAGMLWTKQYYFIRCRPMAERTLMPVRLSREPACAETRTGSTW